MRNDQNRTSDFQSISIYIDMQLTTGFEIKDPLNLFYNSDYLICYKKF